jgi:hypothetical protein
MDYNPDCPAWEFDLAKGGEFDLPTGPMAVLLP